MTIGEHLEELRWRVVRSLVVLILACVACIWPAKFLLELIARPVVLVLRTHGLPESFLATSPVENLLVYIKVVLIFGLIIAAPYVIHQLWQFVAAGLYPHERRWVSQLVPYSVGLFLVGVAFMYVFVLVVSLNFLVGFSGWLPLPDPQPTLLERQLLGLKVPGGATSQPIFDAPPVPQVVADPNDPPAGAVWFNIASQKLKLRAEDGQTYSIQVTPDAKRGLVRPHFRIGEYLSFVLVLTIAFGVAFQTPLVVLFLARSGLVPVTTLRKYRKVVILMIVVVAGVLAPPDLASHLLLAGPMWGLFELGLILAWRDPKARETARRRGEEA